VTRTPDAGEPASLSWTIPSLPTTATLSFTVKVDDDAWDKQLVNAVTSPRSANCPNLEILADECDTDDETPTKPKLTLVKNVTDPQDTGDDAVPADWKVSATDVQNAQNAASGNGDPSDVTGEDRGVKDVELLPGTFQLAEAGGPSGYAFKGSTCVDDQAEVDVAALTTQAVAFDTETNRVALAPDDDITCTVTNEAIPGTFQVAKSSDPTDGATVAPGQTVTYTLQVTHLAGVSPRDVHVEDDLSGILDDATDFTVVSTTPAGTTVVNPTPANGQKLTWTIPELDTTATITYSVKVKPDAFGVSLRNVVTAPKSTNCPTAQSTDPACSTKHPTAKWTLEKTSNPVSGTEVDPLDKVTYTLKAVNISDAAVTGMSVTDDLSDVLDDATLDAVPAGASLTGTDLVWAVPTLAARGDAATLVYTVTVRAGASAATLHNAATPDQPSGSCVAVGACETTHPVPEILGEEGQVPRPRPAPAPALAGVGVGVGDTLPSTGGPDQVWVLAGVALLLAGSGLLLRSRRRKAGTSRRADRHDA
jgi:fimbrial isopeptide formation D2 family protein/LPXTG-motif cell wall-anchored protein